MIVVVVPTYCERRSAPLLAEELLSLGVSAGELHLIVVDDASPDGTAEALEAAGHPRLHVIRRSGPRGRGLAGREGFLAALDLGAELVVEMDGDGSHRPADLPGLLGALDGADVVVGSRYVPGGRDGRGAALRGLLSRAVGFFLRRWLGVDLADPSSGYRVFRREALLRIDPASLRAVGPEIVEEVLLRARRLGLALKEHPITMAPRGGGRSKLGPGALLRVLWRVVALRFPAARLDKGAPGDES